MRWAVELVVGVAALATAVGVSLPPAPRAVGTARPATSAAAVHAGDVSRESSTAPKVPYTASYTLEAKLDPNAHKVRGKGTIEFVNSSQSELSSLFFHLYLNAFKNDRSLFLRSPFGVGRSSLRAEEYGYVDVERLAARELGGVDLWPTRVPHSPGDPEDETDIEVPLPRPLLPGERLTLEIVFESQLPSIVERTGRAGSFHFMGQWFPKLAKLEPDGRFAHFAFHPFSEFFADFGRYDVTLDVPAAFTVGASGDRVSTRVTNGRRLERYVLENAHDFAWTAWDRFVEHQTRVDGVSVRFLLPPGHDLTRVRTEAALARALPYFGRKYGRYPYPTLTVVHPPQEAAPSGGMEYPTLITTGAAWYVPYTGVRALEALTVHELGHQWFYGLLASNEMNAPFLDEGLTSFAELTNLSDWLGPASGADVFGLKVSVFSAYRAVSAAHAEDEILGKPAPDFSSFQNLGALVYARTSLLFETVARVFGRDRLDRALEDYAASFRFGHPTAADLLQKVELHVGRGARAIVEQGLFARGRVNYLVRDIMTARDRPPAGYFERASGRERVVPSPLQTDRAQSRLTVYRHGSLEVPVDVLLVAEDGSRRVEHWDGRGFFKVFDYEGKSPLVSAIVDPEHKVLIDDDLLDNHTATTDRGLPRVNERLAYFAALALGGLLP